jgi:hypothetical protein
VDLYPLTLPRQGIVHASPTREGTQVPACNACGAIDLTTTPEIGTYTRWSMLNARELTYGIAIGAAAMYLLDLRRGDARLATIRQKATRAADEIESAAGIGARDLEHRASGLVARLSRVFGEHDSDVSDEVLVARVRAKLGHCARTRARSRWFQKEAGASSSRAPFWRTKSSTSFRPSNACPA